MFELSSLYVGLFYSFMDIWNPLANFLDFDNPFMQKPFLIPNLNLLSATWGCFLLLRLLVGRNNQCPPGYNHNY